MARDVKIGEYRLNLSKCECKRYIYLITALLRCENTAWRLHCADLGGIFARIRASEARKVPPRKYKILN